MLGVSLLNKPAIRKAFQNISSLPPEKHKCTHNTSRKRRGGFHLKSKEFKEMLCERFTLLFLRKLAQHAIAHLVRVGEADGGVS